MGILNYFLPFLLLSAASCDDCISDKSQLAHVRLRKALLCDYDRNLRPVLNYKDPVRVFIRMILKYYNYDIHDNSFTIDSWFAMSWVDQHLKWTPDDFDSLSTLHLADSDIWVPDLSVYNRREQSGNPAAFDQATCLISNLGQVSCVPPVHHTSICVADLTKYPFDTHNCTIRFGSWVHSGEELDIQVAKNAINTEDLVPNGEWELVESRIVKHPGIFKCCPNNTYPSINFSFRIRRLAGAHAASVILPAIALIILTFASLWLSPDNNQRLILCYINVVNEFLYVQYISWMIPMTGDKIPLILLFARDSLLLSAFAVVFSLMVKSMAEREKIAPAWVSKIVCIFVAFKPGQFIFLDESSFKAMGNEEDGAAILAQNGGPKNNEWRIFGQILDRIFFLVYVIVYLGMIIGFTP
uniref:Nicotinic acetylcholine receptor a9 subunit n=1 Tax=Tribolium castaneum TaxID=7070 RepID=C3TS62_TRICA|nr:nicotinic acetylcholine receptor a9 subunit [Tribolium castaneum]